jgi:hypothetical protein
MIRRRLIPLAVVFTLSVIWFSDGVERIGLASLYGDPVSRIGAQDDAVYAREAIEMVQTNHWLTPSYLGRYALNKPPLLQWLTALSIKTFGLSAWALRVPSLLAAAATVTLLFALVSQAYSWSVGMAAVLLLGSCHLFYDFARLCMTDMLLTCYITAAVFILARDPVLGRRSSLVCFGLFTGLAILTKAAAGVLPLIVLLITNAFLPRHSRASLGRLAAVIGIAGAVALPWHIYQVAIHPHWFIAEYLLTQHVAIGITAPPQYSSENHLVFYARRLFFMDPVLSLIALAALPMVLLRWRQRPVLMAWLVVTVIALFGFRYRAAYYLLPLVPVLAWLASELLASLQRVRVPAFAVLILCAVIKTASAEAAWGIDAGAELHRPVAPALERYCDKHRANDLILVGEDDLFYASALPLSHVRYCLLTPHAASGPVHPALDFVWLGISLSVAEFDQYDTLRPVFRQRLAQFDLPSDSAIGTVIRAESPAEVAHLIEAHPESDFWVPSDFLRSLAVKIPHQVELTNSGGVLLLARESAFYRTDRACHL